MFEFRIHGRGGQGVVTAAEILSLAAFRKGFYAQAFPSFGSERMGAPVMAFCRLHQKPIRSREPVLQPDALVIQDSTLLHQVDLFSGIKSSGFVLINSSRTLAELGLEEFADGLGRDQVLALPATDIALRKTGRPLPNAVLIGGIAALTGLLDLESVGAAIRERFPGPVGGANAAGAAEAYEAVRSARTPAKEVTDARPD